MADLARFAENSVVPVVGRTNELAVLDAAVSDLERGKGHAVFLEGEPGIGKSRLLQEFILQAREGGSQVFAADCDELEQTRPFGALVEAFECRPASDDPERAAIGRMLYPGGPLNVEATEYRVVEAFVALLERMAASGSVILALEDLHWADPGTLLTFHAVHRRLSRLPVGLIATMRPAPHSRELETLVRGTAGEGALHLRLPPLDPSEVRELAEHTLGTKIGPRLQELLAGAAGNPLFVKELVAALVEEEIVKADGSVGEIDEPSVPPSLRLTILRRLSSLPAETIELLRICSVLGSTFSLGDLASVCRRPALELLPPMEIAMTAGLLVESGSELTFRHDLLREVVYQDLPKPVRAGLHREVGQVLGSRGARPERVALHFALGAGPGDREAIEWLERAAREVQSTAPKVAADMWRRALEIMERSDPRLDSFSAEHATQLIWSGKLLEGEEMARSILVRPHDPTIEGRLRLSLGRALIILGRLDDALEIIQPNGTAPMEKWERVQLLADASHARFLQGDLIQAESMAHEALEADDSEHAILAVCTLSQIAMFRGETTRAIALSEEVEDRVAASRTFLRRLPAGYFLALSLLSADRFDEMDDVIRLAGETAERLGNTAALPYIEWAAVLHRFHRGDWDDAAAFAESGLALAADIGVGQGSGYVRAVLALLAAHRGNFPAAEAEAQAAEAEPRICWFRQLPFVARALVAEGSGERMEALEWYEKAWRECLQIELVSELPSLGPRLISLRREIEDLSGAEEIVKHLEEAAAVMRTPTAQGAALLARGVKQEDVALLRAAVDAYRRSPRIFERARAFEDAGFLFGRLGQSGGVDLLLESLSIYEGLGAEPHVARVSARLRELGARTGKRGRRGRPSAGWEALTSTELQVVTLVAQGLTNRDIASRLYISHRTVETHITHVFQKLGFTARAELMAEAMRRGL